MHNNLTSQSNFIIFSKMIKLRKVGNKLVCLYSCTFSSLIIIRNVETCATWHSGNSSIQSDFDFSFSQIFNFHSVRFLKLWKNSNYTGTPHFAKLTLYFGPGESNLTRDGCKNCTYTASHISGKLNPYLVPTERVSKG